MSRITRVIFAAILILSFMPIRFMAIAADSPSTMSAILACEGNGQSRRECFSVALRRVSSIIPRAYKGQVLYTDILLKDLESEATLFNESHLALGLMIAETLDGADVQSIRGTLQDVCSLSLKEASNDRNIVCDVSHMLGMLLDTTDEVLQDPLGNPSPDNVKARLSAVNDILRKVTKLLPPPVNGQNSVCSSRVNFQSECLPVMAALVLGIEVSSQSNSDRAAAVLSKLLPAIVDGPLGDSPFFVKFIVDSAQRVAISVPIGDDSPHSIVEMLMAAFDLAKDKGADVQTKGEVGEALVSAASSYKSSGVSEADREMISRRAIEIFKAFDAIPDPTSRDEKYSRAVDALTTMNLEDLAFQALIGRLGTEGTDLSGTISQAKLVKSIAGLPGREEQARDLALQIGPKLLQLPRETPELATVLGELGQMLLFSEKVRVFKDVCNISPNIELAAKMLHFSLSILEDEKIRASYENVGLEPVVKDFVRELDDPARAPGAIRFDAVFNCLNTIDQVHAVTDKLVDEARATKSPVVLARAYQKALTIAKNFLDDREVRKTNSDLRQVADMVAQWVGALWSIDPVEETISELQADVHHNIFLTALGTGITQPFTDLIDERLAVKRSKLDGNYLHIAQLLATDVSLRQRAIKPDGDSVGMKSLLLLFADHGREHEALQLYRNLPPQTDNIFYGAFFSKLSMTSLQKIKSFLPSSLSTAALDRLDSEIRKKQVAALSPAAMRVFVASADEKEIISEAPAIVSVTLLAGGDTELRLLLKELHSSASIGALILEATRHKRFELAEEFADQLLPADDLSRILSHLKGLEPGEKSAALLRKAESLLMGIEDQASKQALAARLSMSALIKEDCNSALRFSSIALSSVRSGSSVFAALDGMMPLFKCGQGQEADRLLAAAGPYSENLDLLPRLAVRLFDSGEVVKANEVLSLAIDAAKSAPAKNSNSFSLLLSASTHIKCEDFADGVAQALYPKPTRASNALDAGLIKAYGEARSVIAESLANSGLLEKSADFLTYTTELPKEDRSNIAAKIVNDLLDRGVDPDAISTNMRSLLTSKARSEYEYDMLVRVKALARLGAFDEAVALVNTFGTADNRVDGIMAIAETLPEDIRAMPLARRLFGEAMQSATQIANASPRSRYLAKIASGFWTVDEFREEALAATRVKTNDDQRVRDDLAEILELTTALQEDAPANEAFAEVLVDVGKALDEIGWAKETSTVRHALLSRPFLIDNERIENFAYSKDKASDYKPSGIDIASELAKKPPEDALRYLTDDYVGNDISDLPVLRLSLNIGKESYLARLSRDPLEQVTAPRALPILPNAIAENYMRALAQEYTAEADTTRATALAREALEVIASSHQSAAATAYFRGKALRKISLGDATGTVLNGSRWRRLRQILYEQLKQSSKTENPLQTDVIQQIKESAVSIFHDTPLLFGFVETFARAVADASGRIPDQLNGIGKDEALIHYRIMGDAVYAVVATRERTELHVLTNREFDAVKLSQLVGTVRKSIEDSSKPMQSGQESEYYVFDFEASTQLYKHLIEPLMPAIADKRRLILIPDGELLDLSFALLTAQKPDVFAGVEAYRNAPWLVSKFSIETVPSLAIWRLNEGGSKEVHNGTFLGLGNPMFANKHAVTVDCEKVFEGASRRARAYPIEGSVYMPGSRGEIDQIADSSVLGGLVSLPETECELNYMASQFQHADVWTQATARENRLKKLNESGELARYEVIAFATHAIRANGANAPGIVLTPPGDSDQEDDGLLIPDEIAQFRIGARFVILSACSTGAGSAISQEAFSGLTSSFLLAGTQNVLVSSWDVDSQATARILAGMMDGVVAGNDGIAGSLQASMKAMLSSAKSIREAHPVYWAAFAVVTTN
ncbi:CHAT domain-containing protein [Rhizobium oryziradicis]|uniref:CHAT domain-containing protein n=1 Tax=Rhizobium oryziradicis TaxID=1867956 RepID=UPI0011153E2E|nr:CHAT domain-containing protein [Rhizobium oryziradicis]